MAVPAEAQVSQFFGFPGEYAASRPSIQSSNLPYSQLGTSLSPSYSYSYSYSPAYSQPVGRGWTPVYAPGPSSLAWPSRPTMPSYGLGSPPALQGTGYDAGLFSGRRLYGTGYDAGLFSGRR
jgi:hypothetical protein